MGRDARNGDNRQRTEKAKTRLTLRPGQNGTKKLAEKYGHRLLAVRYRYDPEGHVRYKTVEIIEEVLPWTGSFPSGRARDALVFVRVCYEETALREQVKAAGGIWKPERKLWKVPLPVVYSLGLEERIVP